MKLRRESAESGDCSVPKGELNKLKFRAESIWGLRGIEWVELAFPDVNIARARKRERTRRSVVTRPEGKV
jgi:hypothetical protein